MSMIVLSRDIITANNMFILSNTNTLVAHEIHSINIYRTEEPEDRLKIIFEEIIHLAKLNLVTLF